MSRTSSVSDRLDREIQAYEAMRGELEAEHRGKWVVFHEGSHVNTLDSFEVAARWALVNYGDDSFLIRKVGEQIKPPPILSLPVVSYGP